MIIHESAEPIAPTVWLYRFESDLPSPTFYVWVDGRIYTETTEGSVEIPVGVDRVAQLDVFDSAESVPAAFYPSTVTLRWEVTADTALSRVEQWVEDAWVVRASIPATGAGLSRWESAALEDGATHQFRVVPVDGTGRDGIAREFAGVVCRWPDAPGGTVAVVDGEFVVS